jgi:hypothetical protein
LSYIFIFPKQFYFIVSSLKIIGHGNPDSNFESPCRSTYRILVGKPVGKRPFESPRKRWEANIKVGLREMYYADGRWMELA